MTAKLRIYQCPDGSCPLGSRTEPGQFTGGITADQVVLLTGQPLESLVAGKDFGEGICPNCARKATPTKETHTSVEGNDPHQHQHDTVAARVADANDELDADGAQAALEQLVAADEAKRKAKS